MPLGECWARKAFIIRSEGCGGHWEVLCGNVLSVQLVHLVLNPQNVWLQIGHVVLHLCPLRFGELIRVEPEVKRLGGMVGS